MEDVKGYVNGSTATRFPCVPNAIYKRHLVSFCNKRCGGVFIDFKRLSRDRVVRYGGTFPDQWLELRKPCENKQAWLADGVATRYNGDCADEDRAMDQAKRASLICATPPRALAITKVGTAKTTVLSIERDMLTPHELCCPITMLLFEDPVQTIRGKTYERDAISQWLELNSTDPLTGEMLPTTALYEDVDMRARCLQWLSRG